MIDIQSMTNEELTRLLDEAIDDSHRAWARVPRGHLLLRELTSDRSVGAVARILGVRRERVQRLVMLPVVSPTRELKDHILEILGIPLSAWEPPTDQ